MRLFRKNRDDRLRDTDSRLVESVRALGYWWDPATVALTAVYLTGRPKLVRDLIDVGGRPITMPASRACIGDNDQPPGIEEDTSDLPSVTDAAARVGEYLSSFGDGLVDETADSKPLYARDLEALRQDVEHESAGILPSGRPWPPKPNPQAALIRAGHRIAELEGALNAIHELALDDDSEFWTPVYQSSTRSRMLKIREITASTGGVRRTGEVDDPSHDDKS